MQFINPSRSLVGAAMMITFCLLGYANAQQAPKAEVKDVKIAAQNTPKFSVQGVKDKKWRPKTWLELEVDFEVDVPKAEFADEVVFKFYLILDSPRESMRTLTGEIAFLNIEVKEVAHAVAYVSPSTLRAQMGKDGFSEADVKFWGVELYMGGQLIGGESSNRKKWWESEQSPAKKDGLILNKKKTPFAPLWGDYHADVRAD